MHILHLPQSTHVRPVSVGMPIHDHWAETAEAKGFEIIERVDDRYHLLLRCDACSGMHVCKLYVLMNNQPQCPHCVETRWRDDASAAELTFLRRDPEDRHYGCYKANCGHKLRRQFELIKRIAAGTCAHRCEICQNAKEQAEAEAQGWVLIGAAPTRDLNYRTYRHSCGHEQMIARVNMQSGRFNCEACGKGWASAPSYIYCMRFELPGMPPLIKLGFSRNPESRLNYQLMCGPEIDGTILRMVGIRTGHQAQCIEKRLHQSLKRAHPDAVISPAQYRAHLRVKSEIYAATLEPDILQMLDALSGVISIAD